MILTDWLKLIVIIFLSLFVVYLICRLIFTAYFNVKREFIVKIIKDRFFNAKDIEKTKGGKKNG